MKRLKVGIASYEDMKARTMAVARGDIRPGRGDPKVWFTSAESFAKVLSDKNRDLLGVIARMRPGSLTQLEELTGRRKSNLSRTLKTLEGYGLVSLRKGTGGRIIPEVSYDEVSLVLPLKASGGKGTRAA